MAFNLSGTSKESIKIIVDFIRQFQVFYFWYINYFQDIYKTCYSFLSRCVIFPFKENFVVNNIDTKPDTNINEIITEIKKYGISEFAVINEGRLAVKAAIIPTNIP